MGHRSDKILVVPGKDEGRERIWFSGILLVRMRVKYGWISFRRNHLVSSARLVDIVFYISSLVEIL